MKALTIYQPWASLIGMRELTFDPRNWTTDYRGLLAIHAKKDFPLSCRKLFRDSWGVYDGLTKLYPGVNLNMVNDKLPLGCVVAVVELASIIDRGSVRPPCGHALHFGNAEVCRYHWIFQHARLLPEPIPVRGKPGLWDWPEGDRYVR